MKDRSLPPELEHLDDLNTLEADLDSQLEHWDADTLQEHLLGTPRVQDYQQVRRSRKRKAPLPPPEKSGEDKPYHHGALREALIEAAVKQIEQDGVKGLSLRALARAVGVSQAAPYRHFEDKEALVAAVAHYGFERLHHQLKTALHKGQSLSEQLEALSWAYVSFGQKNPTYFQLMFGQEIERSRFPELQQAAEKTMGLFVPPLLQAQNMGLLPPQDEPLLRAWALWSSLHGQVPLLLEQQFNLNEVGFTEPQQLVKALVNLIIGFEP